MRKNTSVSGYSAFAARYWRISGVCWAKSSRVILKRRSTAGWTRRSGIGRGEVSHGTAESSSAAVEYPRLMTTTETNPLDIPTDAALREHAESVAEILITRGQTMVAAESCTGGWIAKTLTDIAGSSAWFECGVVAYSY